jgi:hypothetical protein
MTKPEISMPCCANQDRCGLGRPTEDDMPEHGTPTQGLIVIVDRNDAPVIDSE